MAKLHIQCDGGRSVARELNWGITRIGRAPDNDIVVEHDSISSHHCQLELGLDFVLVRDCDSTNGTFLDGQPIRTERVEPGQILRLGSIDTHIERSLDRVTVPPLHYKKLPQSVALADGTQSCLHHPALRAAWRCDQCGRLYCVQCIHEIRLVGGRHHRLCGHCSHEVEIIHWNDDGKKKKSVWGFIKGVFKK